MKKFMIVLTAAILAYTAAFGISGCTRNEGQTDIIDPEAIVVMGKSTDMEKIYMKKIFARYKETGKKIYVMEVKDADYEKTAQDLFAKGEGPDILFHFHNDDLNRLDIENFVMFNDAEWADDLTDSAKKYCTDSAGNLLGLPFWENSVSGCYYNKKLFDDHSFLRAHTQNEFNVLCRNIKKIGVTPICWPADGCSWMYQFALDPVFADHPSGPVLLNKLNADETSYAEIPEVEKMVNWLKSAKDNGWFGTKTDYMNTGWNDISGMLNSGKAAMIFIWDTWFYTDFVEGEYKKEDFALMPIFMDTVDGGTYEGGNLNMMMVNKNSDKKQQAIDFISFCAEPENYNYAFDGVPTLSCFKGQTTNIQSQMVTDPSIANSLALKERISTASTKIAGYSADDVAKIFAELLNGQIGIDECIKRLDDNRISEKSTLNRARIYFS